MINVALQQRQQQQSSPSSSSSMKKSMIAFIKAFFFFLFLAHIYMIVFLYIPSRFSSLVGSTPADTTSAETTATTAPSANVTKKVVVVKKIKKIKKPKDKKEPKERPIQIIQNEKVIQVEQIRTELTNDQLQKIHAEFNNNNEQIQQSQQQDDNSHAFKEFNTYENYYTTQFDSIQKVMNDIEQTVKYNQEKKHDVNNAIHIVNTNTDMNTIRTTIKSKYNSESKSESNSNSNSNSDSSSDFTTLIQFLKRESSSNYHKVPTSTLEEEIYDPIIEKELNLVLNGNVPISDFYSLLVSSGIDTDTDTTSVDVDVDVDVDAVFDAGVGLDTAASTCDTNFLMIEANDVDDEEPEEIVIDDDDDDDDDNNEEEEVVDMYVTKQELSKILAEKRNELKEFYIKYMDTRNKDQNMDMEDITDNNTDADIPLTMENATILQKKLISEMKNTYFILLEDIESKYNTIQNAAQGFTWNVEKTIRNIKDAQMGGGNNSNSNKNQESKCANPENVHDMMKRTLQYVIHNNMDVRDAMNLIIQQYNNEIEDLDMNAIINEKDLDELPVFQEPKQNKRDLESSGLVVEAKKQTLKELMNLPIVPKTIRAVDEGIEMIAGYNEALDRIIDFIAGLNESESMYGGSGNEEEATVGKTIESGLVRILDKIDVPKELDAMKEKAGILLH